MSETITLNKYLYKNVEQNTANIEHLNITVAVMSKQYENIQEHLEKISNSLDRLEQRLTKLEREYSEHQTQKNMVSKIIDNFTRYWWIWIITIFYFVANDTKLVENIIKAIKGI